MKKYNNFHGFFMSFYSPSFYKDVLAEWRGIGFIYLFLLSIMAAVPLINAAQKGFAEFFDKEMPMVIDQMQPMEIVDGELRTPNNRPFTIKDPDTGKIVAIVNPTSQKFPLQGEKPKIIVRKHEVIVQKNEYETRTFKFEHIGNVAINKEVALQLLDTVQSWMTFIAAPAIFLGVFFLFIIKALLLAVVGLLLAKMMKLSLDYAVLLRLAAVSMTPVVVLELLGYIANIPQLHFKAFSTIAITICFMLFGLNALRKEFFT